MKDEGKAVKTSADKLRAPFPWFGGKSRCAELVWERFGDVPNYVEPFFGSGAVLLGRPHAARAETVNDIDAYLANFWRAVQWAPDEVAAWADWPVNEDDLHARHRWLVGQAQFRERVRNEPFYYDVRIAGLWVWGVSQWIGSGWCAQPDWEGRTNAGRAARGINTASYKQRPNLTKRGDPFTSRIAGRNQWLKRPSLGRGARGVNAIQNSKLEIKNRTHLKMPGIMRALGSGVLRTEYQSVKHGAHGVTRPTMVQVKARLPNIATNGDGGRGVLRQEFSILPRSMPQLSGTRSGSGRGVLGKAIRSNLTEYMWALAERLRRTRVCCGDWKRILGRIPTTCIGLTAVFLDPPYGELAERDRCYSNDSFHVANEVREWAIAHGNNRKLRIALCGYKGEHKMPDGWECVAWKANGGYGNQSNGRGRENATRERVWFSPHCLKVEG